MKAPMKARCRRAKKKTRIIATIICAILVAALLGGFCGAAFIGSRLNSRLDALEASLSEREAAAQQTALESAKAEEDAGQPMVKAAVSGVSPSDIYEQATRQVVGIRTEITMTNFFGMTTSGAVSGSGFIISCLILVSLFLFYQETRI